jgi:hypothetical protein
MTQAGRDKGGPSARKAHGPNGEDNPNLPSWELSTETGINHEHCYPN